jgi:hypothetical protein
MNAGLCSNVVKQGVVYVQSTHTCIHTHTHINTKHVAPLLQIKKEVNSQKRPVIIGPTSVAQAIMFLKGILCFAKFEFLAINIDNIVIFVVRFRVNTISSYNVVFYQDTAHMSSIGHYYIHRHVN